MYRYVFWFFGYFFEYNMFIYFPTFLFLLLTFRFLLLIFLFLFLTILFFLWLFFLFFRPFFFFYWPFLTVFLSHVHFFFSHILLILLFTFQKIKKFILIPCRHHYCPPKVLRISMSTLFNTPHYASHYSFYLNCVTLHIIEIGHFNQYGVQWKSSKNAKHEGTNAKTKTARTQG